MKRPLLVLMFLIMPLLAGTMSETVVFSMQDLIFYRADDHDVVEIKGHPVLVIPGAPRMPRIVRKLVIPSGAVLTDVRIVGEDWQDIPGTFDVIPAQPDIPLPMPGVTFEPELYPPDAEIYSWNKPFPGFTIKNGGTGNMNGYRIAHVEIFPLRYIPAQKKLQLATSISYEVEYMEDRVDSYVATARQLDVFGNAVRAIVANPQYITQFAPRVRQNTRPTTLPPGNYEYVVISAPPMDTVFERFAEWKTKKGIPATVVDVSWISSNYTGYDVQEKIRNFIDDARNSWGTIYFLLGGSGDQRTSGQNIVPARMTYYYTYSTVGRDDTIPSDLYYADLDGDWDFNGNHVYGQLGDSVDMYADVYVGRASVYNVAMAQNFVDKVLTYEKNPPTDYLKKMLLPTAILWSSYEERPMQDSIASMTPTDWTDGKLYERNGTLSRQWMIDSMNVGYGMGHWVGHGNENGIYMGTPYLNSSDADNLVNGDRQGIANSIGCMCGGWDLVPGGDCFAEHLVNRVGGGLVAALMNSRYGWGAYVGGYVPGPSERIDTTFYYNVLLSDMFHIGEAHSVAKDAWVYYADSGYQYDMTRWCLYELNLFGDPEMPLWTDTPQNLTVNFPSAIPIGNQNVNIVVTSSGSPVSNALVCLHKGEEVYVSGHTNTAGLVTLSVYSNSPGSMNVTVTAQNHYPFEDSLVVQSTNYAYVTFLNCLISDSLPGGNNNSQLNPGESVQLPVWVMNWGQTQGNGITGTLSTDNVYATLSDTTKSFGNIAPNDSAYTGPDGFDMVISPSCPDSNTMLFTLTCRDNSDSTWVSQFSLTVSAPVLVYHGYSVSGNGILEPGETADIIVTLQNEGGATASNISATLLSNSSYLTIDDGSGSFGTIQPGGSGSNASEPFVVTAAGSAPYGLLVACDLAVVAGLYEDTLAFDLAIGEPVPSDTGYYYGYYSGGLHVYAPDFEWLELAPPGPGVLVSEITNEDADTVTVVLPFTFRYYGVDYTTVGLCSNGFLELGSSTYRFGANTGIPAAGGPQAMVAPMWTDLDPSLAGEIYQYYDAANHRWLLEFSEVARYGAAGDRETFQVAFLDPSYYPTPTGDGEVMVYYLTGLAQTGATFGLENAAETVGLEYYYDGSYHQWAAAVTDSFALRYTTYPPDYVGVEEYAELSTVPLRTMLAPVYPKPFSDRLQIRFTIGNAGSSMNPPTLRIYNAAGRLVKAFNLESSIKDQELVYVWDGLDGSGREVPSGVYFIRLDTADSRQVEKAILLR